MAKQKIKIKAFAKLKNEDKRLALISIAVFVGVIVFCAIVFAIFNLYYSDKILPHVMVGNVSAAGKTTGQLDSILQNQISADDKNFITLHYNDKNWNSSLNQVGIKYDFAKSENEAMLIGHRPSFLATLKDQISSIFFKQQINLEYTEDQDGLHNFIAKVASEIDKPEKNASLNYDNGQVSVVKEQSGQRLNQPAVYNSVIQNIQKLVSTNQVLELSTKQPDINEDGANSTKSTVQNYLSDDFHFTYQKRNFVAVKDTLWTWLTFTAENKQLKVDFDRDKMKQWIDDKIADKINDPMTEARLKLVNGQVSVFQQAKDGTVVDQDKLVADIIAALQKGEHQATINTTTAKAKDVDLSSLSNVYVSDKIGTATTSFGNSPANRIHNIQTGAAQFNGVLIKPGEEVSTVGILGQVDASTGYLPELVITTGGTKPEYGGGLCQVSTTLFRAVMNAGLKITERTNHSYRVPYYEPPVGMDATVFIPAPDFKFINTYDNYLLLQTSVSGNNITFDIYGKSDGRTTKVTNPTMYDVTPAPEPLYTETDTLCKGEVKRQESGHDGAKASFDYYVYNASGSESLHQTFNSAYVPWQAKYLVGTKEGPDCAPPQ